MPGSETTPLTVSAAAGATSDSSCEHSGLPVTALYSASSSGELFGVRGTSQRFGAAGQVGSRTAGTSWEEMFWEEWVSSLLWGVREILSLKLKRGEVSAVVGEDGPALDTVLEGPLLSVGTENKHHEYRQSFTIYSYFITYMTFVIPSIAHCQKNQHNYKQLNTTSSDRRCSSCSVLLSMFVFVSTTGQPCEYSKRSQFRGKLCIFGRTRC